MENHDFEYFSVSFAIFQGFNLRKSNEIKIYFRVSIKLKNNEKHRFSWKIMILHILGIFADFQQNGKFYEIRK